MICSESVLSGYRDHPERYEFWEIYREKVSLSETLQSYRDPTECNFSHSQRLPLSQLCKWFAKQYCKSSVRRNSE